MSTSPLKIVFLIDEQSLMRYEMQLEALKICIMRIIIYYTSLNFQVLWGYRFFSTITRYACNSMRRFQTPNDESFRAMDEEYKKRDAQRPATIIDGTPINHIKQVLKEVIGDFQWDTDDSSTSNTPQNFIFLITSCPYNVFEMNQFYFGLYQSSLEQKYDNNDTKITFDLIPTYFNELREELKETLLPVYNQRNISLNLIDIYFKSHDSQPFQQKINKTIRHGFSSCFNLFKGNYISYQKLIEKYEVYGNSFLSEFHNYLPFDATTVEPKEVAPVWKGPFKTRRGEYIGISALFNSSKLCDDQSFDFYLIEEIRAINTIHANQFSPSWIITGDSEKYNIAYKLTLDSGEPTASFNKLLDDLHCNQSILIAKLIPIKGYEHLAKYICIEPYSISCASIKLLNENYVHIIPAKDSNIQIDEDYPIGTGLIATKLQTELTELPLPIEDCLYELQPTIPEFIKRLIDAQQPSADQGIDNSPEEEVDEEEVVEEKVVQLPSDEYMFGKLLKKLYLEALYTQRERMDDTIVIINTWIEHLIKLNKSVEEIISILYNYTISVTDLDFKHKDEIQEASKMTYPKGTVEQTYQYEWWQSIRTHIPFDPKFEKMCCVVLKLKEAELQVILHCFLYKLTKYHITNTLKRDPIELAEDFFNKVIMLFSLNDINDFLIGIDSEEGPEAMFRRDPCELSDHAFVKVLEERFHDLPDMIQYFREASGADDMESITSDIPSDEIIDRALSQQENTTKTNSKNLNSKNPQIDTHHTKPIHPPLKHIKASTSESKLETKEAKAIHPARATRTNSNPIDQFLKRTVVVNPTAQTNAEARRGEAARAAIAKVERSMVNGRPTIKRSGSFTKSAQPSKKQKTTSTLSKDTGTVILRKNDQVQDEEVTPRTSLNRFLNTNIFTEYAEYCTSPTSRSVADEKFVPSHFPDIETTPQTTSTRFRKIMLERTPHREEDSDEYSLVASETNMNPPYTPRTAAKRQRDRISRTELPSGESLTTRLQSIFEQEKQQQNKENVNPSVKRNIDELFDDDPPPVFSNQSFSAQPFSDSGDEFDDFFQ